DARPIGRRHTEALGKVVEADALVGSLRSYGEPESHHALLQQTSRYLRKRTPMNASETPNSSASAQAIASIFDQPTSFVAMHGVGISSMTFQRIIAPSDEASRAKALASWRFGARNAPMNSS